MTNPPQGSGEHEDPDRQATQPTPSFERPEQPAAPWAGPTQPYGQPAPPTPQPPTSQPYGEAQPGQATYRQPQYGQPSYGQPQYGQAPPGQAAYGQSQYGQSQYGAPAQSYGQQYAAPPYGQPPAAPPYGQPAAAPPQKSKVGLIAAITGVFLLLIAVVVGALLALQSTVLDPAAVERDVAAQFEEREGVAIDLSCDEEMSVESGKTYECTGTTADGEDVTLEIRIEDEDSAAYTWTEP